MNERDLSQFQFDYDQTWAMIFLRADGTVLARYGSRNARDGMTLNSIAGLKATMSSVLEVDRRWPERESLYSTKKGPAVDLTRPEDFASPTIKNILSRGPDRQRSCIHCHNIYDAQRDVARERGTYDPQKRWKYPMPSAVGLEVDPVSGTRVTSVLQDSAAQRAGIKVGVELDVIQGHAIHSLADIQFALHWLPDEGVASVTTRGPGSLTHERRLNLQPGWREGDISWRASMYGMPPSPGLWVQAANEEEKASWSIPSDRLALKVRGVFGDDVRKSDLKKDDVIVRFGDRDEHHTEGQFHAALRLNYYRENATLPLTVLRDGERKDVRVVFLNQ